MFPAETEAVQRYCRAEINTDLPDAVSPVIQANTGLEFNDTTASSNKPKLWSENSSTNDNDDEDDVGVVAVERWMVDRYE